MKTISLLLIACLFVSTISQPAAGSGGAGSTEVKPAAGAESTQPQTQGGAGAPS